MTDCRQANILLDCLLWSCRDPVTDVARVSFTALMRLCHAARSTIAEALNALEQLGLISRIKSRQRFGWASRAAVNRYVLHARTESDQPTGTKYESLEAREVTAIPVAVGALERVRGEMARRLALRYSQR